MNILEYLNLLLEYIMWSGFILYTMSEIQIFDELLNGCPSFLAELIHFLSSAWKHKLLITYI